MAFRAYFHKMVVPSGFEPEPAASKAAALPLCNGAKVERVYLSGRKSLVQCLVPQRPRFPALQGEKVADSAGLEPTRAASEAAVLPLHYESKVVSPVGFEPTPRASGVIMRPSYTRD
jgi:hypothetical protein